MANPNGLVFPNPAPIADQALAALRAALGGNLASCLVYGSTVRGNAVVGVSDINLLIVLHKSSADTHQAIADALGGFPQVDPFILDMPGLERTANAFAAKFASIQRNYRLLHGEDVLARIQIEPALQRFLSEQALRNFRLRLVYAFVTRRQNHGYDRFLKRNVSGLFVQCSEVFRLSGGTMPKAFDARVPLLEKQFGLDGRVLRDLLALKLSRTKLSEGDIRTWHGRVIPLLDNVLGWIELHWPASRNVSS